MAANLGAAAPADATEAVAAAGGVAADADTAVTATGAVSAADAATAAAGVDLERSGCRYMVNVASCAAGAVAAARAESLKWLGPLCYKLGGALELLKWKGCTIQVCARPRRSPECQHLLSTLWIIISHKLCGQGCCGMGSVLDAQGGGCRPGVSIAHSRLEAGSTWQIPLLPWYPFVGASNGVDVVLAVVLMLTVVLANCACRCAWTTATSGRHWTT